MQQNLCAKFDSAENFVFYSNSWNLILKTNQTKKFLEELQNNYIDQHPNVPKQTSLVSISS